MDSEKKKIISIDTRGAKKSVTDLRREIKDLKSQLLSLEQDTQEYNDVARRLGDTMHQMVEIQENAKFATADFGQQVSSVSSLMGAASSAIATATGVLSLFGVEGGKSAEEINKLMLTFMSIAQTVSAFDNATKAYSGLNAQLVTYIASKKAEKIANVEATATTVTETTAKEAETVATEGATVAQKGFNAAVKANPLGLLLTAIMATVGAITLFVKGLKKIKDIKVDREISKISAEMKHFNNEILSTQKIDDYFTALKEAAGATSEEIRQMRKNSAKQEWDEIVKQRDSISQRLSEEQNGKNRKRILEEYNKTLEELEAKEKEAWEKWSSIVNQNEVERVREKTQVAKSYADQAVKDANAAKEAAKKAKEERIAAQKKLDESITNLNASYKNEGEQLDYLIENKREEIDTLNKEGEVLEINSTEWMENTAQVNQATIELNNLIKKKEEYDQKVLQGELDTLVKREDNSFNEKVFNVENAEYQRESERLTAIYDLNKEHTQRLLELYREYYQSGLISLEDYDARRIELENNLKQQEIDITRQKLEEKRELQQTYVNAVGEIGGAISGVLGELASNYEQDTKEYKGLKIAETIIATLTGIMKTLESSAGLGPVGWVMGAMQSAVLATTGALQIAKIQRVRTDGSESGAGGGSSRYTINPGVLNNAGQSQTGYQLNELIQQTNKQGDTRVYVLVSDIEEKLNSKKVRLTTNTF